MCGQGVPLGRQGVDERGGLKAAMCCVKVIAPGDEDSFIQVDKAFVYKYYCLKVHNLYIVITNVHRGMQLRIRYRTCV